MESDSVTELVQWLQKKFVELCKAIGQPVPFSGLRISPPLKPEESKYFLLGLETGLFRIDDFGQVHSVLLASSGEEKASHQGCRLFSFDPLPPRLVRDSICQLSTAASLILKRGWLTSHIQLDPDLKDDQDTPYGIDILIKSRTGQILICAEVKRSAPELEKLSADLRACCTRGPHRRDECGFPQNHPNYEFCAAFKPIYFWAVAPDADVSFRMNYEGRTIKPERLPSLPPRSLIE